MKKSKLIAMLNALPGDPEIKLWNGFAQDWVDIDTKLVSIDLVRMNLAYWLESCRLQDCLDRMDWDYQMPAEEVAQLTKNYAKVCKWEDNQYVTQEDIDAKRYAVKTVRLMQAKVKGENAWSRMGDMEY